MVKKRIYFLVLVSVALLVSGHQQKRSPDDGWEVNGEEDAGWGEVDGDDLAADQPYGASVWGEDPPVEEEPTWGEDPPVEEEPTWGEDSPVEEEPTWGEENQPVEEETAWGEANPPLEEEAGWDENTPTEQLEEDAEENEQLEQEQDAVDAPEGDVTKKRRKKKKFTTPEPPQIPCEELPEIIEAERAAFADLPPEFDSSQCHFKILNEYCEWNFFCENTVTETAGPTIPEPTIRPPDSSETFDSQQEESCETDKKIGFENCFIKIKGLIVKEKRPGCADDGEETDNETNND